MDDSGSGLVIRALLEVIAVGFWGGTMERGKGMARTKGSCTNPTTTTTHNNIKTHETTRKN